MGPCYQLYKILFSVDGLWVSCPLSHDHLRKKQFAKNTVSNLLRQFTAHLLKLSIVADQKSDTVEKVSHVNRFSP